MQKPIEELFNEYREFLLKPQARAPMVPAPYPDNVVIEAQLFIAFITGKGYEVIIKPTPEMLEAERNRLLAQREELDDRIQHINEELGYTVIPAPFGGR